jgi:hypothetical protein
MPDQFEAQSVLAVVERINRAWLDGRPADVNPYLHDSIVMVFPGFGGRITGREALVGGFVDFCSHAVVHDYRELDHHVDVVEGVAVVSYRYEMVYERSDARYRATGRDLWVLHGAAAEWVAVWRTMFDLNEVPA